MQWREQIPNVLWTCENFLDKQSFNDIKKKVLKTETIDMEQSNFKYKAHKGRLTAFVDHQFLCKSHLLFC